jgi:hypothetical protein
MPKKKQYVQFRQPNAPLQKADVTGRSPFPDTEVPENIRGNMMYSYQKIFRLKKEQLLLNSKPRRPSRKKLPTQEKEKSYNIV